MSLIVSFSQAISKIRITAHFYQAFQIFHSNQGSQGLLRTPSKQQLESTFGTSKDVDVIKYMLGHGKEQPVDGMNRTTTRNAARTSIGVDTRGKSNLSGI